jgi:hypothetical protein
MRKVLKGFKTISAGDMSANITSDVTYVDGLEALSFIYSWTGTSPVGSIIFEGAHEYPDSNGVMQTTAYFTIATSVSVAANSGSALLTVNPLPAVTKVRVRYAFTSGTGTLDVTIGGRGIG